ncbi:anthrone oxygenase family protein [Amycolatopsis sp., V23-08]|uniref:Anthrone oxygenase family protein n=1 Tax=Amycolatopsis heterodermiae TaxID=3110235 RepID=A0ABU5R5Z7_9PSEU|nr:anthrone oxygenase family protein [Amycolatopsis sp., V23-08]MEA5361214.1 anthrone oxygenase family protein [Amycolatopsis sp., V23-08]
MSTVVLVAAVVAAGLIAGLFYAYSCSVMPGLARGDDKTFVEAMRGINVAIVNPVFMLTFLGAPLLAGVAIFLNPGPRPWVIAGFVCLAAMLVITGALNIPLNNALESGGTDYAALRAQFETSWVRWNVLRTIASTAGFGCLVAALLTRRG